MIQCIHFQNCCSQNTIEHLQKRSTVNHRFLVLTSAMFPSVRSFNSAKSYQARGSEEMALCRVNLLLVIKIHPDECDSPFTIDGGGTGSIHYGVPSKLFTRARDDQEGLFCAFLFFSTESQNLFVLFQIPVLHVSTRNQD